MNFLLCTRKNELPSLDFKKLKNVKQIVAYANIVKFILFILHQK